MQFSDIKKYSTSPSDDSIDFDRNTHVVPPLELSRLHQKKKAKSAADLEGYSPIPTNSEYAIHPPSPGVAVVDKSLIKMDMKKYVHANTAELNNAFDGLTMKRENNQREIVENNLAIYRQDRDYEQVFYENRVGRTDKQQLNRDIGQHRWYINKYEGQIPELKREHLHNKTAGKRLKQNADETKNEIQGLKADIKEIRTRKDIPKEILNENLKHAIHESEKIKAENEKMDSCIVRLEKKLKRYQSRMSHPQMNEVCPLPSIGQPVHFKTKRNQSTTLTDEHAEMNSSNSSESHIGKYLGISEDDIKPSRLNKNINSKKETFGKSQNMTTNDVRLPKLSKRSKKSGPKVHAQETDLAIDKQRCHLDAESKGHVLPPINQRCHLDTVNKGRVLPPIKPRHCVAEDISCSHGGLPDSSHYNSKDSNDCSQKKRKKPVRLPPLV